MKKISQKIFPLFLILLLAPVFTNAKGENADLQNGAWWGKINTVSTAVRKKPSSKSRMLGVFSPVNTVKVLNEVEGEDVGGNNVWYQIDGGAYPGAYIFSRLVDKIQQPAPPERSTMPSIAGKDEHWIDVDLTKKVLTLFHGDKPRFVTYVATGKNASPTITGTYRVWYKAKKVRMNLEPPLVPKAYDLPNVPNSMFYHGSYAIHGTYWHDKFTTQQSSGCTNITQGDAEYLFSVVKPELGASQNVLLASESNQGTIVFNHY